MMLFSKAPRTAQDFLYIRHIDIEFAFLFQACDILRTSSSAFGYSGFSLGPSQDNG